MRLKYFMRGIGIGIILTALILSIGNPREKLTDEEIIKRASALGMTMMDDGNTDLDKLLDKIKPTGNVTPSIAPTPELTPAVSPNPTSTAAASPQPTAALTSAPKQESTPAPTITAPEISIRPTNIPAVTIQPVKDVNSSKISFNIESGMSSGKVAELLEEKGLIDDADEFNTYIVEMGKASVIKIGTYTLPKGSTYGDIISEITK
jgi:hypothetical protein